MKNIYLVPLLLLALVSCQYKKGFDDVVVDGKFSIKVAGYLSKTTRLHPNPDLQYENRYRTVYLLVLDTSKSDGLSLDSFTNHAVKLLAASSQQKAHISRIDSISTLNGSPARQYELVLNLTGEDVYFNLVTIEGKTHFYQTLGWTIYRRKDKYASDINKMVTSIKPL